MTTLHRLRETWRTRKALRTAAELVGMLALVTVVGAYQTREHPRGALPALSLRTLDGAATTLAPWRGRTTVLEVWAPWCGVCKAQTDNLARARRWLGARANVISVAASYQDVDEVRRSPLAQHDGVTVLLGDEDFTRRLRVRAFPTVFVLDARGRVVSSVQGYTTTLGLVLRALWYG
ncbi:MAG: TlpA disulfide reductase family protein [Polyangiales bacterium]